MIFVNWVVKFCATCLTDLCVIVHKTGRLSECKQAVGYFRKEHSKDEKEENQYIMNNISLLCEYVTM